MNLSLSLCVCTYNIVLFMHSFPVKQIYLLNRQAHRQADTQTHRQAAAPPSSYPDCVFLGFVDVSGDEQKIKLPVPPLYS